MIGSTDFEIHGPVRHTGLSGTEPFLDYVICSVPIPVELEGLTAEFGAPSGLDGAVDEIRLHLDDGVPGEKGNFSDSTVGETGFTVEHAGNLTGRGAL